MFQFSPLAAIHLCIQCKADWLSQSGCPIRISTDQRLLAAPRSFSQLSTSFVASRCLGIHRAPLVAFPIPKARITTFRFETRVRSKVMSGRSQNTPSIALLKRSSNSLSENSRILDCQRTRGLASFIASTEVDGMNEERARSRSAR
jgi:hypothetical protein